MIDNPETLEEKMQNAEELVHQFFPDMPVEWMNARVTFGLCLTKKDENGNIKPWLIRLSRPLTNANPWSTVKDTVLHEIAHALTPGHHHDKVWKAKCVELGATPERCYRTIEDPDKCAGQKVIPVPVNPNPRKRKYNTTTPKVYRYLDVCDKCGKLMRYRSRLCSTENTHVKCGGKIRTIPNPLYTTGDYDADVIYSQLKEKIIPILASCKEQLGIAKPQNNDHYMYLVCKLIPSYDERREMYKRLEGLYEHVEVTEIGRDNQPVEDSLIVKQYHNELHIVYVAVDHMRKCINDTINSDSVPEGSRYSINDLSNIVTLEVLSETERNWSNLIERVKACPSDRFRVWLQNVLNSVIELADFIVTEKSSIRIRNACMCAYSSINEAVYYLNGKLDTRVYVENSVAVYESLKKPDDLEDKMLIIVKLMMISNANQLISSQLKEIVDEIRALM